MGRIPAAVALVAASLALAQDAPDSVIGIKDGSYATFTPGEVVTAGAEEAASTYRFFAHYAIQPQATQSGDLPKTYTILAPTLFRDGVQIGPFHTQYEGSLELNFSTGAAYVSITIATVHTFGNGKKLTTRKSDTERVASTGSVFAISQFSGVTNLALGPITYDDGTSGTITTELLADPVTIGITATLATLAGRETVSDVKFSSTAALTMYQLRSPILAAGGGGGGGAPLSDATPKPTAASGQAGGAATASRGDHEHAGLQLSSNAALATGATAAAGSASAASRQDHIHPQTGLATAASVGALRTVPDPGAQGVATGDVLTRTSATAYAWSSATGGGAPLSDETPLVASGSGAAGSGAKTSRDDHVHPARDVAELVATGTAPADVAVGGNQSSGSSDKASRSDHAHLFDSFAESSQTPKPDGSAAVVGILDFAARADHVHQASGELPSYTSQQQGYHLAVKRGAAAVEWVDPPLPGTPVSTATPKPLAASGAAGTSGTHSRGDHAHPTTGLRLVNDPSHIADGHVLTVESGAYSWAAQGGSGGGGGSDWTQIAANTRPTSGPTSGWFIDSGWTYTNSAAVNTCWNAMSAEAVTQAMRVSVQGSDVREWAMGYIDLTGAKLKTGSSQTQVQLHFPMAGWEMGVESFSVILFCSNTRFGMEVRHTGATATSLPWKIAIWTRAAAGGGGGEPTPLSDGAPAALAATAAPGVGTKASRGDHVHPLPAVPSDHADKDYALAPNSAGTASAWSSDLFDADAELTKDIASNAARLDTVTSPTASTSSMALANGYLWQLKGCHDQDGLTGCTGGFAAPSPFPNTQVFATQAVSVWTREGGYTFTESETAETYHAFYDANVKNVNVRVTQYEVNADTDSAIIVSGCPMPFGTTDALNEGDVFRLFCRTENHEDGFSVQLTVGGGDDGDTNMTVRLPGYNSGGVTLVTVAVQVIR